MENVGLGIGAMFFMFGLLALDSSPKVGLVLALLGLGITLLFSRKYHYFNDPDLRDFERRNKRK